MLYCDKVSILLRDEGRFYHSFFLCFSCTESVQTTPVLRQVLSQSAEKTPRRAAFRAKVCAFVENIYNLA